MFQKCQEATSHAELKMKEAGSGKETVLGTDCSVANGEGSIRSSKTLPVPFSEPRLSYLLRAFLRTLYRNRRAFQPRARLTRPRHRPCDETIQKPSRHHFLVGTKLSRHRLKLPMTLSDQLKETVMTAIVKAFSNVTPVISADLDSLKTIALFCGAGLLVSLLAATYGLDFGVF